MRYVFKKPAYKILIPLFDALGYLIFFPIRLFKKPPLNPKNILIVRLDHIGDFVCTTPLFKNLKNKFPEAKITVLVNSASKDLAYRNPNIDKVITFSPFYLGRGGESSANKGLTRVIRDIRNIGFDLGIEPRGDLLSILIMRLGGVKYRVGYGITGGGFFLNKEGRYDRSKHIIDRNLALLEDLNIPVEDKAPAVYFDEKDVEDIERLLQGVKKGEKRVNKGEEKRVNKGEEKRVNRGEEKRVNRGEEKGINKGEEKGVRPNQGEIDVLGQTPFSFAPDKAVVIHPFAGAKAKEWPLDNFQKLINGLKDGGCEILLVGSKGDHGAFENVIDLRGKVSLPQLAYLIKSAGSFIGLDSGPANIAAALNVPSVIICSGTNIPQLWIPNNPNTRFVYKDTECKPCGLKICKKEKHECMESITVEEVFDKFKEIASPLRGSQ